MTRVSTTRSAWATLLLGVVLAGGAASAEEAGPKPQEPKAPPPKIQEQPPKAQEQKPPEPKKEEKKDEKKEEPKAPAQPPAQKPQESKPSDSPAKAPEAKKEEPKAQDPKAPSPSPSSPPQKAPEKAPETKPAENGPAKPAAVPPIIAVKLMLMADPRLFPYEINVEVSGDVAELSGKVADESEKTAATEIARGLEGIKSVTNNIEVAKDLGRTMAKKKDEIIIQYVKDRFGKSKTLETSHFDVKSEDGIVSLSGKTKFLVIVLEAAEAARQVPGVKAVRTDGIRMEGSD
ncbi:MAG: BON domain-containing protein [Nitrospiraceae bacterium]